MKILEEVLRREISSGASIKSIADKYGMNYQSLVARCGRLGVSSKRLYDVGGVCADYASGKSVWDIGRERKLSGKVVWSILKKAGVVMRKSGPRIVCNEDFFSVIDSEEKAYWLGVMATDGSLSSHEQKWVAFGVKGGDMEWVAQFRNAVGSDCNLSFTHNQWDGLVEVKVTSERMWGDLVALGIMPNKSLIIRKQIVASHLERHYWRGVFDGDGSHPDSAQVQALAMCTGSKGFAEDAKAWLDAQGIVCRITLDGSVFKVMLTGKENVRRYFSLVYGGRTVCLRRKERRIAEILGETWRSREGLGDIQLDVAGVFLKRNHYLGTLKPSKTYGWYRDDVLVGVAAIGSCSSPTVASEVVGEENAGKVRELHRFCMVGALQNEASKFLAAVLKLYATTHPDVLLVVTFADAAQGHEGVIYKAVGGVLRSEGEKQLTVVTPGGQRLTGRQEVVLSAVRKEGCSISDCRLEESAGKRKFILFLGDEDRRNAARLLISNRHSD
jgi:hypothetical protein